MIKKLTLMKTILAAVCAALLSFNLSAQIVSNERLLSFEGPQLPAALSATHATLGISNLHYKDGKHSLQWTFEPGSVLSLKRDLKFEPKDPTGEDLYLSAFIVWIYNDRAQDATIEFQFLKDGKKCTSFPFGINFTGWRGAWVCYERDMEGTPETGMNELRIVAPPQPERRTLHRPPDNRQQGGCPPANGRRAGALRQQRNHQPLAGDI